MRRGISLKYGLGGVLFLLWILGCVTATRVDSGQAPTAAPFFSVPNRAAVSSAFVAGVESREDIVLGTPVGGVLISRVESGLPDPFEVSAEDDDGGEFSRANFEDGRISLDRTRSGPAVTRGSRNYCSRSNVSAPRLE